MADLSLDNWHEVARRVRPGCRLRRAWPLAGGVSAQTVALEIAHENGRPERLVVRCHGDVDFGLNPAIAAQEFALLAALTEAGLPVPRPVFLDPTSELLGRPYLVTSYLPGRPHPGPNVSDEMLVQMATGLARIHALPATGPTMALLPAIGDTVAGRLGERPSPDRTAPEERQLRDALATFWPLPTAGPDCLLHGDYWPGNLLWQNGRLSAILDWEDAQRGDPLADLAQARLEILWGYGNPALEAFTAHCLTRNPLDTGNLPYWDIWAALRSIRAFPGWAENEEHARRLATRHRQFANQALARLGRPHIEAGADAGPDGGGNRHGSL